MFEIACKTTKDDEDKQHLHVNNPQKTAVFISTNTGKPTITTEPSPSPSGNTISSINTDKRSRGSYFGTSITSAQRASNKNYTAYKRIHLRKSFLSHFHGNSMLEIYHIEA